MNKKKILIVEDDDIVAQLVNEILQEEGLDTEIAVDGLEGLEKIKQNKFDLIISDFRMPRMKGDQLYLEVQKFSEDLATKIIFISGSIDDFKRSIRNRLLPKPFSYQQLIEVVEDLLKHKTYTEKIECN